MSATKDQRIAKLEAEVENLKAKLAPLPAPQNSLAVAGTGESAEHWVARNSRWEQKGIPRIRPGRTIKICF